MLGGPVACRTPYDWMDDSQHRLYGSSVDRISESREPNAILTAIDNAIEAIASIPSKIARMKKKARRTSRLILGDKLRIAQNKEISRDQIEQLLMDPNPLVRLELAWNENISDRVLYRLKHDPDAVVARTATIRLNPR